MANPYKDGRSSYQSGWTNNPYKSTVNRDEWQRGFDDAEAAAESSNTEYWDRYNGLYNVPDRAKHEYIAMEDDFSPSTVLAFTKAMIPDEEATS